MKLRYRTTGILFIPQYQSSTTLEWLDFKAEHVKGFVHKLCYFLGERRFDSQYYFKPKKNNPNPYDNVVFFDAEWKVMAFLGASKSFYTQTIKEFEL